MVEESQNLEDLAPFHEIQRSLDLSAKWRNDESIDGLSVEHDEVINEAVDTRVLERADDRMIIIACVARKTQEVL